MSSYLQKQVNGLIESKMGTSASHIVSGVVTWTGKEGTQDICTVCPVDIDALWDMKIFYGKTKLDRAALQKSIERVSFTTSGSIIGNQLSVGDKVTVGYNEDKPYVVSRVGRSYAQKELGDAQESATSYDWLKDTSSITSFGTFNQQSPIPNVLQD